MQLPVEEFVKYVVEQKEIPLEVYLSLCIDTLSAILSRVDGVSLPDEETNEILDGIEELASDAIKMMPVKYLDLSETIFQHPLEDIPLVES